MKNIAILFILFAGIFNMQAQQGVSKEIVFVNEVKPGGSLPENIAASIRNNVIEGLIASRRLVVKDIKSDAQFQNELSKRAADASISEEEYGFTILRNMNARWVVGGTITRVEAIQKKSSDGSRYFDGQINVSLNIIDVSTGTISNTKSISSENSTLLGGFAEGSSFGDTEEEAIANACLLLKKRAKAFAEENFSLKGIILEVASEKKGKAEEVYIGLGELNGVKKGDIFEVFEKKIIVERETLKKIGELKVKAVEGDEISLCDVTKEGKVILEKIQGLEDGKFLIVESRPKKQNILF